MEPARDESPVHAEKADEGLSRQVYEQLRIIARTRMANERAGHSLGATALVHEAYLKLQGHPSILHADRVQFFHAAAEAMRRILIDHARTKGRVKRGGGLKRATEIADVAQLAEDGDSDRVVALDAAIQKLESEEPQTARVLKLRFFTGLSVTETADVLGLSERTVGREWQFARAWLYDALKSHE